MSFTDDVWAALPTFIRDADTAGVLRTWLAGLTGQVQPTVDWLTSDTALNPTTCPSAMLPLVAALSGVDLTGVPAASARAFVAATSRDRGTTAAITARVAATLTGAQTVLITNPSLNTIAIQTYAAETPDVNLTIAVARAEVPAWAVLDISTTGGIDYATLSSRYATYSALGSMTYAQMSALT